LMANVKAGPPPVVVPPASAAAPQRAVGPSHLLGDWIRQGSARPTGSRFAIWRKDTIAIAERI
jgi:hypothetical protein